MSKCIKDLLSIEKSESLISVENCRIAFIRESSNKKICYWCNVKYILYKENVKLIFSIQENESIAGDYKYIIIESKKDCFRILKTVEESIGIIKVDEKYFFTLNMDEETVLNKVYGGAILDNFFIQEYQIDIDKLYDFKYVDDIFMQLGKEDNLSEISFNEYYKTKKYYG